jgi:uncharacterized protein
MDRPAETHTRIVLRPIGNPLPLGFLALAAGTTLVSGVQLEWLDGPEEELTVALALIAFVFPAQVIASVFGFLGRDVVAGTGMGILAVTWLTVGLSKMAAGAAPNDALGMLLLVAAAAMAIAAAGGGLGKLAALAVLGTTSFRYAVTGIAEIDGGDSWTRVAGITGLVLAAVAFYAALAMLIEDVQRRTVLPVGRRASGRRSLEQGLQAQVERLEGEAGVREQL